jgi:hypothetical protein
MNGGAKRATGDTPGTKSATAAPPESPRCQACSAIPAAVDRENFDAVSQFSDQRPFRDALQVDVNPYGDGRAPDLIINLATARFAREPVQLWKKIRYRVQCRRDISQAESEEPHSAIVDF